MKRIAVIGGGISGLSATFSLEQNRRAGAPIEYVLYESRPRLGGVVRTESVEGFLIEAGPDSFLTEKPWAADLCRQVGLADQLITSNDAERKTYILIKGKLVGIPDGLMFMVPTKILPTFFSPLFSFRTKLQVAREWFQAPRKVELDETVATFLERHYGREMIERVADPLLSGIYGGEASQLSIRAVLPRFLEMESTYGSLGRAMLASRGKGKSVAASPLFTSLKNGMQQMGDAVAIHLLPSAVRLNTPVETIRKGEANWFVSAGAESGIFDAVILAIPVPAAARLLQANSAELASDLSGIHYSSSVTVALAYDHQVRSSLPPGFGFLVPHSEGKSILAATFVHNKFPYRAPEGQALIRCFLGGTTNEGILQASEQEILQIVRNELRQILGIDSVPIFSRVYKWRSSMAQYGVGHLERLECIERLRNQLPGLALAGNGYHGIGVPDCVRSGISAVSHVLTALGLAEGQASAKVSQLV